MTHAKRGAFPKARRGEGVVAAQASGYSLSQRFAFVAALLILGAASFYAGGGLLTRAYPAVFPGENAPLSGMLTSLPGPTKVEQPGADSVFNQRRNFLIVGVDRRSYEPIDGEHRTDAIMVATVDPVTHSTRLLSFPRDLYIELTGKDGRVLGQGRINESWPLGIERRGGLDGAAAQLRADMKHNFGIDIHHYAVLDFEGVETLIDALGGITLDVPEELAVYDWYYSDESGRREPDYISFPPGEQHIDGYEAVAFGRNRQPTDLERVKRQALVIETALSEGVQQGFLNNPLETYNAFNDVVYHDVSRGMIPGLAGLILESRGELETYSIADPVNGIDTVTDAVTAGGGQVLEWNRENVRYWLDKVFGGPRYAESDVMIRNAYGSGGDDKVDALGRHLQTAQGLPTVYHGPDTEVQDSSSIVVHREEHTGMAYDIAKWMDLPEDAVSVRPDDDTAVADVVITIGRNFERPD